MEPTQDIRVFFKNSSDKPNIITNTRQKLDFSMLGHDFLDAARSSALEIKGLF